MIPYSFIIELLCLAFSILYLRKEKQGPWRYFPWFILVIAFLDGAGWFSSVILKTRGNHWIYNIALVIFVGFISWVYYKVSKPLFNSKPWLIAWLAIFVTLFIIESFRRNFLVFNFTTLTVSGIVLIIASGFYYYLLLRSEQAENLLAYPEFWIVTGVFMFYFGSTATNILFPEIMKLRILKGIPLREMIYPALNLILYGCWTYAFRWRYKEFISS